MRPTDGQLKEWFEYLYIKARLFIYGVQIQK